MNSLLKHSLFGSALLLSSLPVSASTLTEIKEEHSVTIDGLIEAYEPSVVNLSVPTSFSFTIDPNNTGGNYFSTSEYTLTNRSTSPLKVSVTKFEPSAGSYVFNDVLPTKHTDWYGLSEDLSMKDFALGLKVVNPSEWLGEVRTSTIWAKEVQDSSSPIEIGVLPEQSGKVRLTLEAKHGLKFSKQIRPAYDLNLLFEFVDEITPSN